MGYRNISQAVRTEFGEPMSEVIKGFARMGYSRAATAQAMGMHVITLGKWLSRLGLDHLFVRARYNDSCTPRSNKPRSGRPRGIPMPRRYNDDVLLSLVRQYQTSRRFDMLSGSSSTTVRRWFGSWRQAKLKAKEMCNGTVAVRQ